MKVSAWLLAGVGAPLILGGAASAGFTGITTVSKPNTIGGRPALVCNVFATFDRPGQDRFLAAAGTPESPMEIHVVGGTFYQDAFGTDTPPHMPYNGVFSSIVFDSFVTIGAKLVGPFGQPMPPLWLSPGWPGFGQGSLAGTNLGWASTPDDPNTDPFNPQFINGNGQVLIGQFSTLNGVGIVGMFRVLVISDNVATQLDVSFSHIVPGPGAVCLVAAAGLHGRRRKGT